MCTKTDNKRIFQQYYIIKNKFPDMKNFAYLKNIDKIDFVDSTDILPQSMYNKNSALRICSVECFATEEKIFQWNFSAPVDISECDCLSFGYNARTDSNLMRLDLISETGELYQYVITLNSERWTKVILDISKCNSCKRISGLQIAFYGNICIQRVKSVFLISEFAFGSIADYSFRLGKIANYIKSDAEIIQMHDFLKVNYIKGFNISFPEFYDSEYSVLENSETRNVINFFIKSKNDLNLRIIATEKSGAVIIHDFIVKGQEEIQKVRFVLNKECFTSNNKVYKIDLIVEQGQGELELHGIFFEQPNDEIEDKEAVMFLSTVKECANPYKFEIKETRYNVRDFGAFGDGITCDNEAIQNTINYAATHGGGYVVFGENRDYIATHIVLCDNIALMIQKGSSLVQSSCKNDYFYEVNYGHDNPYSQVNWAHNFLTNNKPLIYACGATNIKICGGGVIRMADNGCVQKKFGFPFWPSHCNGNIHIAPIGFVECRNVDVQDITINRASTYHCFFVHCTNLFASKLRLFNVRCLSADGIGLCGCENVLIHAIFIETNDDGITLVSVNRDPRGIGSWWDTSRDIDNSVSNVEIDSCYINSSYGGAGKAVAFIPWGTNALDLNKQVIKNIHIHDCVLKGGFSIGAWPDNPYNGKKPFDNTETDDYSPVKNINLEKNIYLSPLSFECIEVDGLNLVK